MELKEGGVTGPTIFVSLAAALAIAEGVAFSGSGFAMIKEVVWGVTMVVVTAASTESLSITGGMDDVRFCFNCSMTSATFEELASLVTGITATSPWPAAGDVAPGLGAMRPRPCIAFT